MKSAPSTPTYEQMYDMLSSNASNWPYPPHEEGAAPLMSWTDTTFLHCALLSTASVAIRMKQKLNWPCRELKTINGQSALILPYQIMQCQ